MTAALDTQPAATVEQTASARARAERIRVGIHSFIATRKEIADAYRDRDWTALGYDSWESYVDGEFSEARVRLTADERREAVAELRLAGMSQRAIGATLGVGVGTVNRDLATVPDGTVPDRITGTDGREQPATRPAAAPAAETRAVPDVVRQAVEDVKPDLTPEILRLLERAGADGLSPAELIEAMPDGVSTEGFDDAIDGMVADGRLARRGRMEPGGPAWYRIWLAENHPSEDHPDPMPGEGRSAALTSVPAPTDESRGGAANATEAADTTPEPAATAPTAGSGSTPPSAYAVTPEQRAQIEADAERGRAIAHAHKIADQLVREVSAMVTEIEMGVGYGEPGLFTAEMVTGLRAQADRIESYLRGQQ